MIVEAAKDEGPSSSEGAGACKRALTTITIWARCWRQRYMATLHRTIIVSSRLASKIDAIASSKMREGMDLMWSQASSLPASKALAISR